MSNITVIVDGCALTLKGRVAITFGDAKKCIELKEEVLQVAKLNSKWENDTEM